MRKLLTIFAILLMAVVVSTPASAFPTLVQFDPTASSAYSVMGIQEFDWSSAGNLVVEQILVGSSLAVPTYAAFLAAGPTSGVDYVDIAIHGHARLSRFEDILGNGISSPGLSTDGSTGAYEVTGTLDGVERGVYYSIGGEDFLDFTNISGTFQFYLDGTPDSNVLAGTGFNDGDIGLTPFLWGALDSVSGNFSTDPVTGIGDGSSFLTNRILGYDPTIIETDPTAGGVILIGSTFDTTLQTLTGLQPSVGAGGFIGDAPYQVGNFDIILNADASSQFSASAIPEPASILLFGTGLLALAGFGRKKHRI